MRLRLRRAQVDALRQGGEVRLTLGVGLCKRLGIGFEARDISCGRAARSRLLGCEGGGSGGSSSAMSRLETAAGSGVGSRALRGCDLVRVRVRVRANPNPNP